MTITPPLSPPSCLTVFSTPKAIDVSFGNFLRQSFSLVLILLCPARALFFFVIEITLSDNLDLIF